MNTYQQYQRARDVAWQVLLKLGIRSLPVDAKTAAEQMGVILLPFPDSAKEPQLAALLEKLGQAPLRSLRIRGIWRTFVQQGVLDDQHVHFAIAHELGHILLRHETIALAPGVRAFRSRENAGDVIEDPLDIADYAADIFAIRLLAPACVLHEMNICSPQDMMRICGLPPRAAKMRAERMTLLNSRNAFFSHPLERKVHAQFFSRPQAASISLEVPPAAPQRKALPPAPLPMIKKPPSVPGKRRPGWLLASGFLLLLTLGILMFLLR